jgi:hypothetical protein
MSETTFDTFDREALAALQARDVPRMRAADLFSKTDEPRTPEAEAETDEAMARWDAYLAGFAKLVDAKCLCCGVSLRCPLGMGVFGGVKWDLAHGEAYCKHCGYPMRGIHHIKDLGKINNLFLAYHPSELAFRPEETP